VFYLIYDSRESSSNVLLHRIPVKSSDYIKVLVGQLNNDTTHTGLGIIDTFIYSVANATFIGKVE
jgi:hypothetical protein